MAGFLTEKQMQKIEEDIQSDIDYKDWKNEMAYEKYLEELSK